jgi:hypothetical protein
LIAKLGKKQHIRRNLPPRDNFEEIQEENWPCCYVFINFNGDKNVGQRILFEHRKSSFSSTIEQAKNLEKELNSRLVGSNYIIQIEPETEKKEFWKISKENKNLIQSITLSFNSPNLFDLPGRLEDGLKEIRKDFNATNTLIELANPEGYLKLPKNKELLKQGVKYITDGGGECRVKIKGGEVVYDSRKKIKAKRFKELEIEIKNIENGQEAMFSMINKIFK